MPAETLARPPAIQIAAPIARQRHTLASRLAFLTICAAIALTTLAYGTVHNWAVAIFVASAIGIVCLWSVDALVLRSAQITVNPLQWPVVGMIVLGLVQLLPLRSYDDAKLSISMVRSLSLDPYATRLVVVQTTCLLIYFAATTIFVDTPPRLRTLVRTITIFGFLLAVFGLTRAELEDAERVAEAIRALGARLPTYITLKDVKKRWGYGQEDTFPVAQFEKLWVDMTALPEIDSRYVVVPRLRGQQLKDQAQLDGWLRDGSAAYVESLCEWE